MKSQSQSQENRDPLTGETGAHPVGTGVGAAGGAAAGAAVGSFAGPVGAVIGVVGGAIAGGLAGKAVAETIDPTVEDAYWRENFSKQPYVETDADYQDYEAAYRTGYEARLRYEDALFEDVEPQLERDYENNRNQSPLNWSKARHAVRDAWRRVERTVPGDADRDGR